MFKPHEQEDTNYGANTATADISMEEAERIVQVEPEIPDLTDPRNNVSLARINYAAVSGKLTNDPMEVATSTGKLMMLFSLRPSPKDSAIRVACSGKAALLTRARCVKGTPVLVLGKIGSIGGDRTVLWGSQVQCLTPNITREMLNNSNPEDSGGSRAPSLA
jgi:hypothetical protein